MPPPCPPGPKLPSFQETPRFLLSTFSAFSHNFSKFRTRHSNSNAFHVQRGRLRGPRRHNAKHGTVAAANFDRAVTLCFFQHCGKIPACFREGIRLHSESTSNTVSFNSRARAFRPRSRVKIGAPWLMAHTSTYAS